MGMDAAVVIVRRLLLIGDCYCSILRVIRVVGFPGRYFQHALALDFGPAADANTATPANHATPTPASCTPSSPAPIASTAPDTPNATPRSGSPACLAHDVSRRRQPAAVHTIVIAVVPLRLRQPFVPPQKSLPTAVAHLKVHAPPTVRQLNHRRPDPHFLPLLPPPRPLASPHLVKRYGWNHAPPLALHGHPGPNPQGPPDFF